MNVAAPAANRSNSQSPKSHRLHEMRPGALFRLAGDQHRVLALLSHADAGVSDGPRIWCVIVAAAPQSKEQPGTIVHALRDACVDELRVEAQMQLAVVD